MKKVNSLITFFLTLFLTNFTSAYYSPSSYFSIRSFLYSIDPQTMTLAVIFIVLFAFIFYSLSRMLKNADGQPNTIIAAVISFAISAFAVYGINRSNFDIANLFYNIGISNNGLIWIASIFALLLAFFLIQKFRFSGFFIILGLSMIALVIFTNVIFKEGIFVGVGVVFLILGFFMRNLGKDKIKDRGYVSTSWNKSKDKRKAKKNSIKLRTKIIKEIGRLEKKRENAKNSYQESIYIREIQRLERNLRGF